MASDGLDAALNALMDVREEGERLAVAREAMGLPGGWVGSLAVGYDQLMAAVANKWADDTMRKVNKVGSDAVKMREALQADHAAWRLRSVR